MPKLPEYSEQEMLLRAQGVLNVLSSRRTIRDFSNKAVPRGVIEACIAAAGTAGGMVLDWTEVK